MSNYPSQSTHGASGTRPCSDPECGALNPADAQFCERCGRSLSPSLLGTSPAGIAPPFEQPLAVAEEASSPVVPTPGTHPPGFETISDKPRKLWHAGTLTYTAAGLMILFFWLLFGDFALSIRDRSVGPVVQLMLKGFDTSNLTMSILLSMVPTAITMVLSPVVSYKSDRYRSRWGRRIPFLLIPTPIAAIGMVGLAFCPHLATLLQHVTHDAIGRKAALLTVFAVCWTGFEIAAVVASSVIGGLINDVVPRPVLGRFFAASARSA